MHVNKKKIRFAIPGISLFGWQRSSRNLSASGISGVAGLMVDGTGSDSGGLEISDDMYSTEDCLVLTGVEYCCGCCGGCGRFCKLDDCKSWSSFASCLAKEHSSRSRTVLIRRISDAVSFWVSRLLCRSYSNNITYQWIDIYRNNIFFLHFLALTW